MSYNPKTDWQLNEIVMPADMNRIEQGIADLDSQLGDKANLSDIPTTLPANGGNAKTVDGLSSNVIPHGYQMTYHDANLCIKSGYYMLSQGDSNIPVDTFGILVVNNGDWADSDATWASQIFMPTNGASAYRRMYVNKIFTAWVNLADGGHAISANHQIQHRLSDGTDVLTYATSDNCPLNVNTKVRIMHSPTCPTNYGYNAADNDFWYDIYKLDNLWVTIKAYDVRGNVEFINSCINGTWRGWVRSNDGGNAATVNGLTVQTAVPANAKFTDTTYGAASTSAAGLVSTVAQTFAGVKTFNNGIRSKVGVPVYLSGSLKYPNVVSSNSGSADTNGFIILGDTAAELQVKGTNIWRQATSISNRPELRNLASGTSAATTTNCPSGAWYGQYEEV